MPSVHDLFPKKWLSPDVINGKRPRVAIEAVTVEPLFNPRTKKNEPRLVVRFFNKDLRLVLNKTQAYALAAICKTDDYTRWKGYECVLSVAKAPNGKDTIVVSPLPDAPPPTLASDPQGKDYEPEDDGEMEDNPFERSGVASP